MRAAQCLEVERELLLQAETAVGSREYLYVWECPETAVILGRSGREEEQALLELCRRDNVPLLRRESGGGTVVLGPGCLNYSLILDLDLRPGLRDIADSYRVILHGVAQAAGVPSAEQAENDLAVDGRKFAGCSQRRMRRTLLHHGTLLYDFDLAQVGRYLAEPVRRPAYRGRRSHAEFLGNVTIHPEFPARLHALYPEAERVS